ncbi:MAG: hypothetical protein QXV08_07275 [Desulfurococcus sp.]|uniref:FkbM family methyltransferase n=1 Tax=Desulfurococcus sp. TaxID=51678 RepID=UPI003170376F
MIRWSQLTNIEVNNLGENALCYPLAICPIKGSAKLRIDESSSVSPLIRTHVENYTTVIRVAEVKCVKLSTLVRYIGSADLLKLDAKDLEYEVIREAEDEFKRVSRMIVEVREPESSLDDIE